MSATAVGNKIKLKNNLQASPNELPSLKSEKYVLRYYLAMVLDNVNEQPTHPVDERNARLCKFPFLLEVMPSINLCSSNVYSWTCAVSAF